MSIRETLRAELDAASANPEAALIARHALGSGFYGGARRSRSRIAPLTNFLLAAARPSERSATATTPALIALWTAAAADPRAAVPIASDEAAQFVDELLDALMLDAQIQRISAGVPLLHHPFDDHVPACVHDAFASADQVRTLARRIYAGPGEDLSWRGLAEHVRVQYVQQRHPVGVYTMLLAVVHSSQCPQTRLAVYDLARNIGDETAPRRIVRPLLEAARALEDSGATYLVTPLRHRPGEPHLFPACVTDGQMRAAQLRLYAERPLDPRAPAEENAPWTAQMALLATAHAATCPVVREYLLNYVRTADRDAARTPLEWRPSAGGWILGPVQSLPSPRAGLPGIADRLQAQAQSWIPARLSPPRTQATRDLGSLR